MSDNVYIIRDKKTGYLLRFDRIVNDMDIITIAEPVGHPDAASAFDCEEEALGLIQDCNKCETYDLSEYEILTKDEYAKQEKENKIAEDINIGKEAWKNTSEDIKRKVLWKTGKDYGDKGIEDFLKKVEDTSGITAYTDDDIFDMQVKDLEQKLTITFTQSQLVNLRKLFDDKGGTSWY